jgi:hypothetical protein
MPVEQVLEARRQYCRSICSKVHCRGGLVGTKAQELGALAAATARDVVVAHLDHELWRSEVANIANMSAFRVKADIRGSAGRCLLMTQSGHCGRANSRGNYVQKTR